MPQLIDVTKARESLADIVNKVYYSGEEFIIRKQGVPVVIVSKFVDKSKDKAKKQKNFLDKLASYDLKGGPSDLAENHDKYAWE
jgi:antitoxin (DNA-binding transcriptional repressor) of toxin-antitoxin stability system